MAFAAKVKMPPLPENVMTPDAALERLWRETSVMSAGAVHAIEFRQRSSSPGERAESICRHFKLLRFEGRSGILFDEQRGDLFVARVAGNYLTTDFVATLEYAAAVLHTPLIMVLGHESCGAVAAAIDAVDKNEQFPGTYSIHGKRTRASSQGR